MSYTHSTIIAQCTPKGSGAIALLRMSGSEAVAIAAHISKIPGNICLTQAQSHTIHFGFVVDALITIDQVLFMLMVKNLLFL